MNAGDTFNAYRPYVFAIAYRMLGSAMDAEDMVQETFLRWCKAADQIIQSPKAYLATIVTRLCIDYLRSAYVQRESYIGTWLPEPLVTDATAGSEEMVILADSLSIAFLNLLETLTPTERAVFLLRDVFDYSYAEIAVIVDKSEANCRQMMRRAKQHLADGRPRFPASAAEQERILSEFMGACLNGDLRGLVALLADDVVEWSDGGGQVNAALKPIYGADKVARFLLALTKQLSSESTLQLAPINGQAGLIIWVDGRPFTVLSLDVRNGRVHNIYTIVNPQKLQHIAKMQQ